MEGSGIVSPEGVEYESTEEKPDKPKDEAIGGKKITTHREDANPGDVDELGIPWFYDKDTKPEKYALQPISRETRRKYRKQVRSAMEKRQRELKMPVTRRELLALMEKYIEPLLERMKRIEFSFQGLKCLLRDGGYFSEAEFIESVEKQVINQRIEAVRFKAIQEGLDPDEVENAIRAQEATEQFECNKCKQIKLGAGKTREINIDAKAEKADQVRVVKYCDVCLEIADFYCQKCGQDKKGEPVEVSTGKDTIEQQCQDCAAKGESDD